MFGRKKPGAMSIAGYPVADLVACQGCRCLLSFRYAKKVEYTDYRRWPSRPQRDHYYCARCAPKYNKETRWPAGDTSYFCRELEWLRCVNAEGVPLDELPTEKPPKKAGKKKVGG